MAADIHTWGFYGANGSGVTPSLATKFNHYMTAALQIPEYKGKILEVGATDLHGTRILAARCTGDIAADAAHRLGLEVHRIANSRTLHALDMSPPS